MLDSRVSSFSDVRLWKICSLSLWWVRDTT